MIKVFQKCAYKEQQQHRTGDASLSRNNSQGVIKKKKKTKGKMDEPLMELSTMEMSPTVQLYSPTPPSQRMSNCMDRFVPSRSNSKWQTNFSMIGENSRSARRLFRKSINNEPTRDQSAYSCLLRNELLGDQIEDVQGYL